MLHGWTPVLIVVVGIAIVVVAGVVIGISQVLLAMLLSSAGGLILDFAVARYF